MKPDAIAEMKAFLRERYGIETYAQLAGRIRQADRINLAIFTQPIITGQTTGKEQQHESSENRLGDALPSRAS